MTKTKEEKLQVLVQLAELFNEHEIQWAVGGSLLLYFKGLVSDFHDLDLMIDEQAGEPGCSTVRAARYPPSVYPIARLSDTLLYGISDRRRRNRCDRRTGYRQRRSRS